jgi:hypothetical protein
MFLKRKTGAGFGRVVIGVIAVEAGPGVTDEFEVCAGRLCGCRVQSPYR